MFRCRPTTRPANCGWPAPLLVEIVRLRRRRGEDKRKQQALQELAFRDPLTALANRRMWETSDCHPSGGLARPVATRAHGTVSGPVGPGFLQARERSNWGTRSGDEVLRAVGRADWWPVCASGTWWLVWEAMSSPPDPQLDRSGRAAVGGRTDPIAALAGCPGRTARHGGDGQRRLRVLAGRDPVAAEAAMVAADRFLAQAKAVAEIATAVVLGLTDRSRLPIRRDLVAGHGLIGLVSVFVDSARVLLISAIFLGSRPTFS